jgi:hypothetical protein
MDDRTVEMIITLRSLGPVQFYLDCRCFLRTHLSLELFHAPNFHPIGSNFRFPEESPDFARLGVVRCDNTDILILYEGSGHSWK